ncbi:MAG: hypothetical protein SangKO_078140 [Sandaracinaceae bacterium]
MGSEPHPMASKAAIATYPPTRFMQKLPFMAPWISPMRGCCPALRDRALAGLPFRPAGSGAYAVALDEGRVVAAAPCLRGSLGGHPI